MSKYGIMRTYEAAPDALVTRMEPRLLDLVRRSFAMSESYHAYQLPLFPPDIEHVTPDCVCSGKKCSKCDSFLCLMRFSKATHGRNGMRPECKDCSKKFKSKAERTAKAREYIKPDPTQWEVSSKAYRETCPTPFNEDGSSRYPNAGIYAIRNKNNDKVYIGSSQDVLQRLQKHIGMLKRGVHHNPRLQGSWNKHGEEAFETIVLEPVEDIRNLLDREQVWLDATPSAERYNVNANATGNAPGRKMSPEQRKKLSEVTYFKHNAREMQLKGAASRKKNGNYEWSQEARERHSKRQIETKTTRDKKELNGKFVSIQEWKEHYGLICSCDHICRNCHRSIKNHGRLEFRGKAIESWENRNKAWDQTLQKRLPNMRKEPNDEQ